MEDNNDKDKDNGSDYDLYTEHIVPEGGRKFRRFAKNAVLVIGMAVLFGAVAGLVMLLVYKTGMDIIPDNDSRSEVTLNAFADTTEYTDTLPETSREEVTIAPAVTTAAVTETTEPDNEEETRDEGLDAIGQMYGSLKKICDKVNISSVVVTMSESGTDWTDSTYQNVKEEYGIIVASDTDGYYILTSYSPVAATANITVTYNDGNVRPAKLSAGDPATGLAVIRAESDDSITASEVQLGDSTAVSQGDVLVAVGKLRNYVNGTAYGIAAGVGNKAADTDIEYSLINTDIVVSNGAFGALCTTDGEVVGILTSNYSNGTGLADAYAISDIKALIENLINRKQRVYLGIKGQSVSEAMQQSLGIPEGVYIVAVEGNSPAYGAGIQTGDVLTTIGGEEIKDMKQYMKVMAEHSQGEDVEIKIKRKGRDSYKDIVFRVVLGVQ